MESWRSFVIYKHLIMYNPCLIITKLIILKIFLRLQRQIISGFRLSSNISRKHNTGHNHVYIAEHVLSKTTIPAIQSDKQTIQAHAFLRKDIIREKVKTTHGDRE